MSVPINIPKLGVSMTEGTLVEWLVADGDEVSEGQPLYVVETDKVENEVEATAAGTVRHHRRGGRDLPGRGLDRRDRDRDRLVRCR